MSEKFDTIVIGAGQAGLSAGYHLASRGKPFVILDSADRIGGSWLNRWDSLKLFTPSIRDSLPGLAIGGDYRFPTKDELLDYLERYVATFELPVRLGVKVDGLFREGARFRVTAGAQAFDADHVILATGVHREPRTPDFADEVSDKIVQLHSGGLPQPRPAGAGPGAAGRRGEHRRRDRDGPRADPPRAAGRTEGRRDPLRHEELAGPDAVPGDVVGVGAHPHRADEARPQGPGADAPGPGRPVDPAEGGGHRAGGRRADVPDHCDRRRPATERGRRGARRRQRDLVHRLRRRVRLDRPARAALVRPAGQQGAVPSRGSPGSTCWASTSSTCSTRTPSVGVGKDAAYVVSQLDHEPAAVAVAAAGPVEVG